MYISAPKMLQYVDYYYITLFRSILALGVFFLNKAPNFNTICIYYRKR